MQIKLFLGEKDIKLDAKPIKDPKEGTIIIEKMIEELRTMNFFLKRLGML